MKKLYFLLVFILLASVTQLQAQNFNYKILNNDPSSLKKLNLSFFPLVFDAPTIGISLGSELNGRYNFKDKLLIEASNYSSYVNPAQSKASLKEFALTWNLTDKNEQVDNLRVELSGNSYSVHYIEVPGTKRELFSLRGAFLQFKTPFSLGDLKKTGQIMDTTGTVAFDPVIGTSYSALKANVLSVGFSYQIITNLMIRLLSEDGQELIGQASNQRANSKWMRWYFDILYAPAINIDNFSGMDNNYFLINNNDNGVEKKPFGFRYGIEWDMPAYRTVCYNLKAEVGSRPGIKKNSFYMNVGVGLTLNLIK